MFAIILEMLSLLFIVKILNYEHFSRYRSISHSCCYLSNRIITPSKVRLFCYVAGSLFSIDSLSIYYRGLGHFSKIPEVFY